MKRIFFYLLLLCITWTANAQQPYAHGPQRFNPKVFQQRFEEFTSKKAGFTKEEAEKFFTLFNEMKEKERSYYKQYNELLFKTNENNNTDKELAEKVDKMNLLQTTMANLEPEYYKKFRKIISNRKYFLFKKAERMFQTQELRGRRPQGPKSH